MRSLFSKFKSIGCSIRKDLPVKIPEPLEQEKQIYKKTTKEYAVLFAAEEIMRISIEKKSLWLFYQGLELVVKHRMKFDAQDLKNLSSCRDLSFFNLMQFYRDIFKNIDSTCFLIKHAANSGNEILIDEIFDKVPHEYKSTCHLSLLISALESKNVFLLDKYKDDLSNLGKQNPDFVLRAFLIGVKTKEKDIKNWALSNGLKINQFKLNHTQELLNPEEIKSLITEYNIDADTKFLLKRFNKTGDANYIKILMEFNPEFNITETLNDLIKKGNLSNADKLLELDIKPNIEMLKNLLSIKCTNISLYKKVISNLTEDELVSDNGEALLKATKISISNFNIVKELMKATNKWPEKIVNKSIISCYNNSMNGYLEEILSNTDKYSIPLINRLNERTNNSYIKASLEKALKLHLKGSWKVISDNEIMKTSDLVGHQKLRKIFNFQAEDVTIIIQNNYNGEMLPPINKNFSKHDSDKEIIEAFNILSKFNPKIEDYKKKKQNEDPKKDKSNIVLLK